jgi:ABC-type branched-subunit amino acid transport system substrate-binding protein
MSVSINNSLLARRLEEARVRGRIALLVLVMLAVMIAIPVSGMGASSRSARSLTRFYVPAASRALKLPLVKIGSIAPLAAITQAHPDVPAGIIAGIRGLNRSGGLHGHPVALEFCDDKGDPNQTATCARQLVGDGIVATIGTDTNYDASSQPIFEAASIPEIAVTPISPAVVNGTNVFLPSPGASVSSYTALLGYAVHVAHDSTLAAFVTDVSVAKVFAANIENTLKTLDGGAGFAATVGVPPATGDFTPIGAAVARVSPQGVFSFTGSTNGINAMRAANQLSSSIRHFYFPWAWTQTQLQAIAPEAMPKLIQAQAYPPLTDPRMARMLKDLKAEVARGDSGADPKLMEQTGVDAWVGVQALFALTKGMKSITAQTLLARLNTAKNVNIGPFLPPWTPSAPGPSFYPRASNQNFYFVSYKNGQEYLLIQHPVTVQNALAGKF